MPTPVFPSLASGAITQKPYTKEESFLHVNNDMECGVRFSYLKRDTALNKFTLTYSAITDADLLTLETFWTSMNGCYGTFDFTDLEAVTYHNCRFDNDSFDVKYLQANSNAVTLTIVEQGYC